MLAFGGFVIRLFSLIGALALSLVSLACIVQAQESGPAAVETAWDQAIVHRDARALSAILADNFIALNDDGTIENKQQSIADVVTGKAMPQRNYTTKRVVRITADTATITGIYIEEGRASKQDRRRYRITSRYCDVYARSGGTWKAVMGFGHTLSARILK
ncbi:MAG: nuclear transport factor 2 family protein [Candidatus Eremiobacteraeota bacterium]|nr:nuclear transport factor 2 family protein [Candidatus Eremiobacteraeota bacterium]